MGRRFRVPGLIVSGFEFRVQFFVSGFEFRVQSYAEIHRANRDTLSFKITWQEMKCLF